MLKQMQEMAAQAQKQQIAMQEQMDQGMASGVQGPAPPGCVPANPEWTFPEETKWLVHEKFMSFTGDDFSISDEDGNDVIEAKAAHWTDGKSSLKEQAKDKITFVGSESQQELFSIQKKMWEYTPSYKVEMGGKTVAVIRKFATSVIYSSGSGMSRTEVKSDLCKPAERYKVYQSDDKNAPVLFLVEQAPKSCIGYSGRKLIFYDGDSDEVVAETAEQKWNLDLCGQDQYDVDIQPNVNCLMVFACLIAHDQMEEDSR